MNRWRGAAVGTLVTAVGAFVWQFGSGAVFGQEAGTVETAKVVVRARVLGDDLIRLSAPPERWVATDDGRNEYFAMLERRGLRFVEYAGAGMFFRRRDGRPCTGNVEQFTADLVVYTTPGC